MQRETKSKPGIEFNSFDCDVRWPQEGAENASTIDWFEALHVVSKQPLLFREYQLLGVRIQQNNQIFMCVAMNTDVIILTKCIRIPSRMSKFMCKDLEKILRPKIAYMRITTKTFESSSEFRFITSLMNEFVWALCQQHKNHY